jgi:hypothetical protein
MKNALVKADAESVQELALLKERIVEYDRGFHSAFQTQMGFAFLTGLALLRAKDILPHGQFMDWSKEQLPSIEHRSATRYMKFADTLVEKYPQVGKLATVANLRSGELEPGPTIDLKADEVQVVLTAVHDVADGKTLTDMYRDLGVIRQPQKQKHHPKKITPEEEEESKNLMALERVTAITGDMRQLLHEWEAYEKEGGELPAISRVPFKARQEFDSVRIDLGKVLTKIKKAGRKTRETLYTCPHCKRSGFLESGLRAHRCKALPKVKGLRVCLADDEVARIVKGGGK